MIRTSTLTGLLVSAAIAVPALAGSMTPTEAYKAYRQAFAAAQNMDQMIPYLSSESVEGVSEEEKEMMFGFMQGMIVDAKSITYLSETVEGETADVVAEICLDGQMYGVTVNMATEGGEWKLVKEHFANENYMVPDENDPNMMVPQKC